MRAKVRLFHFISYFYFRLSQAVIRLLPIEFVFVLGRIGGGLAYGILWRRRAIALRNLRLAFGARMSDSELRELNRRHFQLLGANLLAGLKATSLSDEQLGKRVTADAPKDHGKFGCIALGSHTGNWELYSRVIKNYREYRFGAIYQPLANPLIDRYVRATRTKSGLKLFDRRKQLLSCVRFLRDGGVVGMLADQGAGYAGLWTPLFGRLTSSSTLAARLSVRTGRPIVPIAITTSGCARWHLTISDPIYPDGEAVDILTARLNQILEEQICRSPSDWLWVHNRWKPLRPHFLFAREQRRVFVPPKFNGSTLDPFRILIISPHSSEQIESALPAVEAIKRGRIDNSVTVLTLRKWAEIWNHSPAVDRVLEQNDRESIFALAARIRDHQFDATIFFATNWRVALAVRLAGVPLRVARRSGVTSWLCNQHPVESDQPSDSRGMSLQVAQSVGADINSVPV